MSAFAQRVLREIKAKYPRIVDLPPPRWLEESRWVPHFCMGFPGDKRVVAVALVPSASIPRLIYSEAVVPLKRKHPELRVIVCVRDEHLASFPETAAFCEGIGCGMQTYIPQVGMQTVVTTDLDEAGETSAEAEAGWFPKAILDTAQGLRKLAFYRVIDDFCRDVRHCGDDEAAVMKQVHETIDRLFQHYPKCHADVGSFMKLQHFEAMFRQAIPGSTEHVLHSFRVFLAGCTIIDQFYPTFRRAHTHFCLGSHQKLSVEYCWLLTAVFHDIGRPMEGVRRMVEAELEDDDIEVSIQGKDSRWLKENYTDARRLLASLGAFVASGPSNDDEWDAGTVPDEQDGLLSSEWTRLYDEMSSHAVISAFNMLASIVEQARAVDERKNRPFVVSHATPAALAILLHDWRIWQDAVKWRLFPVDSALIPLAALLIFIDTWDDYRRRGPVSPINVESFSVGASGAKVTIRWRKADDYEKERMKYSAFKKALKNRSVRMIINVGVASS